MLTGRRETSNPDFFRAGKLYIKPLTSAEADSNFVRVSRGLFIVLELSVWVGFFMCSTLKKLPADLIINYLILQANIRKNTGLKTQKIRIKKSWEKCFLYGGCLLQYHCIKTAGVATFGKPRSFEKKLKNFRAKYILSQKSAFSRA